MRSGTRPRVIAAESRAGSIAVFPPPHTFFWTREVETNLGYVWYRKDGSSSFSIGIRQAEREEAEEYEANFALYSAPPGSSQRMAMYFYASPDTAPATVDSALRFTRGDFFVTSGEVLVPSYALRGTGNRRVIVADVEWTFPLEFVEVVWGDGHKTERQILPATDFPPFGRHRFEFPLDVSGKKWVRLAVWDSAGNGALVQPLRVD
jgi:hypothetical protein